MTWGNIAAPLVLLLAASATLAQPARSDDGCSMLETLVREGVYRAAMEYKPSLPRSKTSLRMGALAYRQVCLRTVEVATDAFTRAMAGLDIGIGWYPPGPGDYCLSHDLAQCYPERADPGLPPEQLAFVYDAWKGVRNAVIAHMRQGSSSGVATFTAESLEASLWSNLQLTIEGPLYLAYAR